MNRILFKLTSFLPIVLLTSRLYAWQAVVDPSYEPVDKDALLVSINTTPIASTQHAVLLSRAFINRDMAVVTPRYLRLAQLKNDDAHANLWAGMASAYRSRSFAPIYGAKNPMLSPSQVRTRDEAQANASKYYRRALELDPDLGQAHSEFGYWRFFMESNFKDGMEHLKKGVALSSSSPRAHKLYAEALANKYTPFYDASAAEAEYKKAIAVDSKYAAAHYDLGKLYFSLKRYPEARTELDAFNALVPEQIRQRQQVLRDELAKIK